MTTSPAIESPAGARKPLAELTGLTPLAATTACPDPQHVFARLRAEHGPVAPVELEPGVHAWLVMGYQEILTVTRQEQVYSCDPDDWSAHHDGSLPADSLLRPMMSPYDNAFFVNGERHRRLRAPIAGGMAEIDQRAMRRAVAALCTDVIGSFAGRGEADLVADYAAIVPVLAVADRFGLDAVQSHELQAGLAAMFAWGADALAAREKVMKILADVVAARRAAPSGDLTSYLAGHPNLRGDAEVYDTMVLLLVAANENTMSCIAQTLRLMLTDERFAGRLRGGRLGVDDAIDEVLWRDPPMTNAPARYALRDTELAGQPVRRGDAMILGFTAANADPRIHPSGEPWREVGNRAHLSWGAGPHACPAQIPARLIVRTAVETALHLLPGVRLAIPVEELQAVPSPWGRTPRSIPVRFTPVRHTADGES
ncbi:cytochrome P450 [Plantactinospora sp. ZYX-F-223]|uniref:cytochrome P450 n=1 Tax=Plantactinospora sp. ZYX-F-223 TaxID=3144103 RepID=UPI0031FC598F